MLSTKTRMRLLHLYKRAFAKPRVGRVDLGSLRRVTPISSLWGFERGTPIDRHYVEEFLERATTTDGQVGNPISGRVLEIGDSRYADRFGDATAITRVDILDVDPMNREATIVADLAEASDVPSATFDCVICTQTLLLIYDVGAAVRTLRRILRPGGTLLLTVPGISQITVRQTGESADYWRFTDVSLRRLLEEAFPPEDIAIRTYGNVLAATGFLYGIAAQELSPEELDAHDPDYQLVIAARARRDADH